MAADIIYNMGTKFDSPERVYLFAGPEETLKGAAVRTLVNSVTDPDFRDFDYEEIDAEAATYDRILAAAETVPFGSKRRVVLVKNIGKLKDTEQIAAGLAKLPESSCLIFLAPPPADARRKTVISDKFDTAVRKAGAIVQFPALDNVDTARVISTRAEKLGTPIDRPALNLLIELVGSELSPLRFELDKLSSFVGTGNRITVATVELMTPRSPEANVFALVDAVASGNPLPALTTLKGMLDTGERAESAAPKIIGLVARQFRLIAQARFLIDTRYLPGNLSRVPSEVASLLPSEPNLIKEMGKRGWLLNKVTQQAKNFSHSKLNQAFKRILEADLGIKAIEGSVENPRLVLELMLIDLCRIAAGRYNKKQ